MEKNKSLEEILKEKIARNIVEKNRQESRFDDKFFHFPLMIALGVGAIITFILFNIVDDKVLLVDGELLVNDRPLAFFFCWMVASFIVVLKIRSLKANVLIKKLGNMNRVMKNGRA
jgi:uncharacterized membrane protein